MKKKNLKKLKLGAYRVYWKSGGSSIATIGMTQDGERWIAPANWTFPARVGKFIRKEIARVELLENKKREVFYEE